MSLPSLPRKRSFSPSFTLIELMVVIAVIAILASLTLGAVRYAQTSAGRNRATAEITAFQSALDRYKNDNGLYPPTTNSPVAQAGTNYDLNPSDYTNSAVILYRALSGKTNLFDPPSSAGAPSYIELKLNQVNTNTLGANYVKDPFGNAYGYVCDEPNSSTTNVLFNIGFFDLWSTAGQSGTGKETNIGIWVSNWGSQGTH